MAGWALCAVLGGPEENFYYDAGGEGVHSLYSPLHFIIEGGLGTLYNMKLHTFDFARGASTLGRSLAHPIDSISDYGWGKFFYREFLPHAGDGQNYMPNYLWHFVGGGFRNKLLEEYYRHHGYAHPKTYAWLSMYTMHFINEVIQAEKFRDTKGSIDALPDLFFFDLVGKLFFDIDAVNRVMKHNFHLREWSFQTLWNPATNRLINNGQLYWMRLELAGPVSLNFLSGEQVNQLGLTVALDARHQLSVGAGGKPKTFFANGQDSGAESVVWTAGIYYSLRDNPVAVLTYESADQAMIREKPDRLNEFTEKLVLNFYPGWLDVWDFKPGLTLSWQQDALFLGVSIPTWPVGWIVSTRQGQRYLDAK
jgi:hypothetical protein